MHYLVKVFATIIILPDIYLPIWSTGTLAARSKRSISVRCCSQVSALMNNSTPGASSQRCQTSFDCSRYGVEGTDFACADRGFSVEGNCCAACARLSSAERYSLGEGTC